MPLNVRDLVVSARQFGPDERIPDTHAADHGNVVSDLTITGAPKGAVEFALILHDPDAPLPNGFTHWVVYGIDPSTTEFSAAAATYRTGPNTLGDAACSGPQPPVGHGVHHYYFWVYALDASVEGEPTREEFLRDHADHIIEQNRLVATYSS